MPNYAIELHGFRVNLWETRTYKRRPTLHPLTCPSGVRRKEGLLMNVTYGDLFQFCIFIVALVDLCYQIFRGKK